MVKVLRKRMAKLGGKKVHKKLQPHFKDQGLRCSRSKLFDIMRDAGMLVKKRKRYVKTTQSYHRFYKYANIIKDAKIERSEQVWVSDITYIKTKEKSLYLSLVTDAYSKQIMGWELSDNLKTESSIKALKMAIGNRRYPNRSLIHHSDRGFQYCNPEYVKVLDKNGIDISMTTRHDPYENAVAERVNGILKDEFGIENFITQKQANREIKTAIGTYNSERPHLSCGYLTPWDAHRMEGYKLKTWSRKFTERDMSLSVN
jgi:putative transposase